MSTPIVFAPSPGSGSQAGGIRPLPHSYHPHSAESGTKGSLIAGGSGVPWA